MSVLLRLRHRQQGPSEKCTYVSQCYPPERWEIGPFIHWLPFLLVASCSRVINKLHSSHPHSQAALVWAEHPVASENPAHHRPAERSMRRTWDGHWQSKVSLRWLGTVHCSCSYRQKWTEGEWHGGHAGHVCYPPRLWPRTQFMLSSLIFRLHGLINAFDSAI